MFVVLTPKRLQLRALDPFRLAMQCSLAFQTKRKSVGTDTKADARRPNAGRHLWSLSKGMPTSAMPQSSPSAQLQASRSTSRRADLFVPRSLKPLHLATTNHLGCCNQGARAARGADLHQFRETVFLQPTRARAHEASLFGFRWTHLALAPRPQLGARKVPRGSCAGLFIREHRPLWTSSFR